MLLGLKGNLQVKYEKNLMIFPVSFLQILPQEHTRFVFYFFIFYFFLLVSNEVCKGIQLILKTLIGIQ